MSVGVRARALSHVCEQPGCSEGVVVHPQEFKRDLFALCEQLRRAERDLHHVHVVRVLVCGPTFVDRRVRSETRGLVWFLFGLVQHGLVLVVADMRKARVDSACRQILKEAPDRQR